MSRPAALVVVAGTGTEVGKTWVAAQLLDRWRSRGLSVAARKPAQSFDPDDSGPTDAEVLGQASGEDPLVVCPDRRSYRLALAPPMAAARLGLPVPHLADLVDELRWPPGVDVGLVETAGGLRSPQAADGDALDVMAALEPDVALLVAAAGLGTINAVRLSHDAMATRHMSTSVLLNHFDPANQLHTDNLRWLADHDGFHVLTSEPTGLDALADAIATG